MISARNIVKTFTNIEVTHTVLHGISLEVESGEFLSIMGRSGAGKSTLLYQLSLLDKPTSGQIVIDGVDTSDFSVHEATEFRLNKLGFVFQEYALLPELTAVENVMMPLLQQGLTRTNAAIRAREALERLTLGDVAEHLPSQLSGGQQQRVSIARAIVNKPSILFADEPTANLDTETSKVVIAEFEKLNKEGQTIIMVTHEEEYGARAERRIRLEDGRILNDERLRA